MVVCRRTSGWVAGSAAPDEYEAAQLVDTIAMLADDEAEQMADD